MRVVGIDPGNGSSGISFWEDGRLLSHATIQPWMPGQVEAAVPARWLETPHAMVMVYVEVPQNGTHASRGGVHWAAGMVVARLVDALGAKRTRTKKVTPATWRGGLGLPTKGVEKDYWLRAVRDVPGAGAMDSHDEAEAVLIGRYGSELEEA